VGDIGGRFFPAPFSQRTPLTSSPLASGRRTAAGAREVFAGLPLAQLGRTVKGPRLRIVGASGEWVVWANLADLKEAWQKPLRW
jgi:hypothetical protein